MIKRMKEIAYALKVCRKYRLIWNPYVKIGDGYYCSDNHSVHVNPLTKGFITIFMHEVGHHIHHCKVNLPEWLKAEDGELRFDGNKKKGWSIYKNLTAEAIASRFAMKSGKADRDYLIRAFHTYTSSIFRHTNKSVVVNDISSIVDSCYKNERLISK